MLPILKHLHDAVTHPWESLAMVMDAHGTYQLGDRRSKGSPAWHLKHMVEVFRAQAQAASGGELSRWPELPMHDSFLPELLLAEVERFIAWVNDQSAEVLVRPVDHEHRMELTDLIGVMARHIVWHSAAMHYRIKWQQAAA